MGHDGIILVIGATGRQGGAVARHLTADGWTVRALTRHPDSEASRALAGAGALVVQGDMGDEASLEAAMDGAYGVFSVQNWRDGVDAEVAHGIAVADAAVRAGVRHFTYSSVGGAERTTRIPHFESKWRIEEHIRKVGLLSTIWRPVAFMENFLFQRDGIAAGALRASVPSGMPTQLIAAEDIGRFVALGFREPDRFIGTATEIAGDELTPEQAAAAFAEALGHDVTVIEPDLAKADPETSAMLRWFVESGYTADIPALRATLPGLMTLRDWIDETGWR